MPIRLLAVASLFVSVVASAQVTVAGSAPERVGRVIRPLSEGRAGRTATTQQAATGTAPAAGKVALTGQVHAPRGSRVVLQFNGASDLVVTVPPSASSTLADAYAIADFTFPTRAAAGSNYVITVRTAPAGQRCRVYQGERGVLPVAAGAVRIGCEVVTRHVSRSTNGRTRATAYESWTPVLGGASAAIGATATGYGEGRFVAFVSGAAGIDGTATGRHRQVYWHDQFTGETVLVSASPDGTEGNSMSEAPAISTDGLMVAFESDATNLVPGDANGQRDVFVWSAMTRQITRVSVGPGGEEGNAPSSQVTISGDGRIVAFASGASTLTPGVTGTSTINVFRRDLTSGVTTLITRNAKGKGVGGSRPMLSEDGNRLAFSSISSEIVSGDGNNLWDIFVYDHARADRTRVSLTSAGGERNQGDESASREVAPAISGDGRIVAYATTASNVVPGDEGRFQDVFVVNTETMAVTRASVTSAGAGGNADSPVAQGERPALSYDGTWVAFTTMASNLGAPANNLIMHNNQTGETRAITSHRSFAGVPSLSRSAAYVAFAAGSPLDATSTSSGLFSAFTGITDGWFWFR